MPHRKRRLLSENVSQFMMGGGMISTSWPSGYPPVRGGKTNNSRILAKFAVVVR